VSPLLARLQTHGLLEAAETIARAHGAQVVELVVMPGPGRCELWNWMRAQGWSSRNIERVFGIPEPAMPLGREEVTHAPSRRKPAAVQTAAGVPHELSNANVGARPSTPALEANGVATPPAAPPASRARERSRSPLPSSPAAVWKPAPALVPREPGSAPVRLLVLPVERLTAGDQRFRCQPYAATITATTCVERQRMARDGGPVRRTSKGGDADWSCGRSASWVAKTFIHCKECSLGVRVADALGERLPAVKRAPKPVEVDDDQEEVA